MKNNDKKQLERTLATWEEEHPQVSNYMKTAIKTMKKYLPYLTNMLESEYTNGVIEGIINKIKLIKRVSYGYRSYLHLKNRIMMLHGKGRIRKLLQLNAEAKNTVYQDDGYKLLPTLFDKEPLKLGITHHLTLF